MTKKPEREKQPLPPSVEMSEQTFKRLVERLLNTPPKQKPSKKSKRQSRH